MLLLFCNEKHGYDPVCLFGQFGSLDRPFVRIYRPGFVYFFYIVINAAVLRVFDKRHRARALSLADSDYAFAPLSLFISPAA